MWYLIKYKDTGDNDWSVSDPVEAANPQDAVRKAGLAVVKEFKVYPLQGGPEGELVEHDRRELF